MKIFLDFEFIESGFGKPIHPLSVGMVREDGQEYYAEYSGAPLFVANQFVKNYVLPHMKSYNRSWNVLVGEGASAEEFGGPLPDVLAKTPNKIKNELLDFCGEKPQFWAYFADYDWVCLCLTMGVMSSLPNNWPMYCLDLKQEMVMRHIDKEEITLTYPQPVTHNALDDAKWVKNAHDFMIANCGSM